MKNLKDHWVAYNKQISLFSQISNQESLNRQSGSNDDMVFEIVKQRYKNQTGAKFKRFYWWETVRYQPKWRSRSNAPSIIDAFISLSETATEEEVTHPLVGIEPRRSRGREKGRKTHVVKASLPLQWAVSCPH
jgi:hypothetical protein